MSARALLRILVVGVLLLLAAVGWQLELSRQATIAQAERVASNLALTLGGQLGAVLRRIDADLHAIAGQLPRAALQAQAIPRYETAVR